MTLARLPGLLVPLGLCLLVLQVLAPAQVLEELALVLLGFEVQVEEVQLVMLETELMELQLEVVS